MADFLQIVAIGLGIGLQDSGRPGWARFGVPVGGAMDDHAALWANRLVGNREGTPLLELLLQGARLRFLHEGWIAVTGADASASLPVWRPVRVQPGDTLEFPRNRSGLWSYVAVDGGFAAPPQLGSVSTCARARLGPLLVPGYRVQRSTHSAFHVPEGVAGQTADPHERRDYDHPPALRLWPGPQWNEFTEEARTSLLSEPWLVSARSDRVGYRLEGNPLPGTTPSIPSEPVLVGSIQVPPNGLPIVTLRDGPTVGGYPKIALVDAADISHLVQCRPGTTVRFRLIEQAGP